MIIAWSLGGVVGPLATAAIVDAAGEFTIPAYLIAGLAAAPIVLPATTRPVVARTATPPATTARRAPSHRRVEADGVALPGQTGPA